MNRQPSTLSRRRIPFVTRAALTAGLLALTACSGNDTTSPPAGADTSSGGGAAVSTLKVCDLVDLDPLAATLGSTEYKAGPEDVPAGNGIDPGGPQCFAQLEMTLPTNEDLVAARLNIAVVPYQTADSAAKSFQQRLTETEGFPGAQPEELPGDWTTGKVVTVPSDSDNLVYSLAQQDDYLVKVQVQYAGDTSYSGKHAFTIEDVKKTVVDLLVELHTAVTTEITG